MDPQLVINSTTGMQYVLQGGLPVCSVYLCPVYLRPVCSVCLVFRHVTPDHIVGNSEGVTIVSFLVKPSVFVVLFQCSWLLYCMGFN